MTRRGMGGGAGFDYPGLLSYMSSTRNFIFPRHNFFHEVAHAYP